jgi:hypothetical protein
VIRAFKLSVTARVVRGNDLEIPTPVFLPPYSPGIMSQTKQSFSGLSTVKRDFSSNAVKKEPDAPRPAPLAAKKSLVSQSMRALIEQGIAERNTNTSSSSSQTQKRPFEDAGTQGASKRRVPASWAQEPAPTPRTFVAHQAAMAESGFGRTLSRTPSASSSTVNSARGGKVTTLHVPANNAKTTAKPAVISLSGEQKSILELVSKGDNVFYTGSAGTSSF